MISNHTGSLMLQLRNAARAEYNKTIREGMSAAADDIQAALTAFKTSGISEDLAALNGAWARGTLWLGQSTSIDPPSLKAAVG